LGCGCAEPLSQYQDQRSASTDPRLHVISWYSPTLNTTSVNSRPNVTGRPRSQIRRQTFKTPHDRTAGYSIDRPGAQRAPDIRCQ
jgi:hypothetical protein